MCIFFPNHYTDNILVHTEHFHGIMTIMLEIMIIVIINVDDGDHTYNFNGETKKKYTVISTSQNKDGKC